MKTNSSQIVWGIIGCGHIAQTFATSFKVSQGGVLHACAASESQRANEFAAKHHIPIAHESYSALLSDPTIDAIYIATTHNFHFEQIMACLQHDKHVLCEKPVTINAKQAQQVQLAAQKRGLLVMEAVWTRFLPAIKALKQCIDEGTIGAVKTLYANFSLNRELPDEHRLLNPALAGGALLDLGIYPITIADIVFGQAPISKAATAVISRTGVDEVSNYMLNYPCGGTALLSSSFRQSAPTEAIIYGEKGYIRVPHFLAAKSYEVCIESKSPQSFEFDYNSSHSFRFEIEHFNQCLANKLNQSPILPLSKSVEIMQLMDNLRAQFPLIYPGE